ncbi:MAG: hypothetical protein HYZ54_14735 [Ignavibacteriae bacterium]|nr:hypothetical protein [Ignavibacteriota bacterium]
MTDELLQISDNNFWYTIVEKYHNKGGIYKVIAVRNGQPRVINRLLGTDNEGVLYIGNTSSFLNRIVILKKSTAPGYISSTHEFGTQYKEHPAIQLQFPFDELFIELLTNDNPEEFERRELKEYYDKFGELPPFNNHLPQPPSLAEWSDDGSSESVVG